MLRTRAASGVGYGAIGGAASAAFSPDLLKAIDPTGADLNPGQQAVMAGFATLLGGGLAGLAGANAQGGAIAGQNEVLNNDTASQDHIADAVKNGGFGSAALTMLYTAMPWLPGNPFAQATGQAVTSVVNGVLSQAQANYGRRTPPSDADPLTQASDGNNTPSGTAGAVVTPGVQFCDPERGCVMNPPALVLAGTPIVSSGGSDDGSSTGGSGQGPTANNAAPTGSQPPTIGAFKGASQGTVDRINGVISSGKDTTEGSGARNVTMPADDSMNSGFAQLTEGGTSPKGINTSFGPGELSILPDGTKVIARPSSTTTGLPTVEIQRPDGRTVLEIRYNR